MCDVRNRLAELSSEEKEHFLGEVPRLLLEGGRINRLSRLLSDYDFIEAKINHTQFGVKALIKDYDLINNTGLLNNLEYDSQSIKLLKLIQGALRLSAHIISQDTKQLAGQLSARLLDFDTPEIQQLLQQISKTQTTCLRSLRASLSSPSEPLELTLSGHIDSVNAVAVTPDGKQVISGSSDNTVKVWDLNTGAEVLTFTGHSSSVNAVPVTPDGKRVISGASDNTVRVWDLNTGKEILIFNGHSSPVNAVAVTPNGKKVVSASIAKHNSIKVWNLKTGKKESTLEGHRDLVRSLAITSRNYVISGSDDGTIKIWNLKTGETVSADVNVYGAHKKIRRKVYAIAVTLDGRRLIAVGDDNYSIVWDLETGTVNSYRKLKGHTGPIVALAFSPDEKRFISASLNKTLKVWHSESGKELLTLTGHNDSIYAVTMTPDGKKLISASKDKTLKVWNLDSEAKHIEVIDDNKSVNAVTFTLDGNQVIFGLKDNIVRGWDLENIKPVFRFISNNELYHKIENICRESIFLVGLVWTIILHFIIPYSGFFIASAAIGNWYWVTYCFIYVLFLLILNLALLESDIGFPDDKCIGTKYTKYSDIELDKLYRKSRQFSKNKQIISIVVTPNNRNRLIIVNNQLWNLNHFLNNFNLNSYYFLTAWDFNKKNHIFNLRTPSQCCYYVLCFLIPIASIAFFVVYLSSTNLVLFWKINFIFGWGIIHILLNLGAKTFYESATTISITPDGKYLISGSTDKTIKVWNLQTKKLLFTLKGHSKEVSAVTITPDGKYLISGSKDKTIKIWDLENREEIFTFTGHTESINAIKVTSNGQRVISASSDKTIQVWDFASREIIAKFTGESAIKCCAVAPDDVTIVAGEESGRIHFLRLQGVEVQS